MQGYELLYAIHPGTEEEKVKQDLYKVKKVLFNQKRILLYLLVLILDLAFLYRLYF